MTCIVKEMQVSTLVYLGKLYEFLVIISYNFYMNFLWIGFNCLKAREPLQRDSLLFAMVSLRTFWYSYDRTQNDERLSRPWGQLMHFNQSPLDWESSAQTTRRLLCILAHLKIKLVIPTQLEKSFQEPEVVLKLLIAKEKYNHRPTDKI